jgi:hypothetical protein
MTAYKHQMGTDAADGASAIGAVRRLACSAHKFQPTSKVQSTGGRVISLTLAIPTGPTGGASRLALFIHELRGGLLHCPAHRRRAGAHPLSYRLVATVSLRVLGRSRQFRRIGYQPGSYVSDPCEAHCQRPFLESRSDDWNRDTNERPKSWKPQPTRTAP